jgi:hypothetical protein
MNDASTEVCGAKDVTIIGTDKNRNKVLSRETAPKSPAMPSPPASPSHKPRMARDLPARSLTSWSRATARHPQGMSCRDNPFEVVALRSCLHRCEDSRRSLPPHFAAPSPPLPNPTVAAVGEFEKGACPLGSVGAARVA